MSELEKEYEGRVRFEVRDANSEEGKTAVETYGWQEALHGLVTLGPDGKMVGTIPGHRYGRAEVQAKVEELLAATSK